MLPHQGPPKNAINSGIAFIRASVSTAYVSYSRPHAFTQATRYFVAVLNPLLAADLAFAHSQRLNSGSHGLIITRHLSSSSSSKSIQGVSCANQKTSHPLGIAKLYIRDGRSFRGTTQVSLWQIANRISQIAICKKLTFTDSALPILRRERHQLAYDYGGGRTLTCARITSVHPASPTFI